MRKKILIVISVLFILLLGVVFYLTMSKDNPRNPEPVHVSQYFHEAEYINASINKLDGIDGLDLKEVFGGVVSHHISTAIPFLAEFYSKLKKSKDVDTFVVLAPDHFGKTENSISISKAEFITPFGKLMPDLETIEKLEKSGLVKQDENPFNDHSIDSQMLFIGRLFPNSKIVPIMFRFNAPSRLAEELGELLASVVGPNTFIVASVDFSHYLNKGQAQLLDIQSASILDLRNPKLVNLTESDSPQSLITLITAANKLGADSNISLGVFNSSELNNKEDYTTGYVIQFLGSKK